MQRNAYQLPTQSKFSRKFIEQVKTYKTLGVIVSSDLTWNCHVDHIIKKASKKLYSLRILRRAGVEKDNIQKVYLTTVRPMLKYAVPVWQAIPDYLSEAIEVVQKRSLKIILLFFILANGTKRLFVEKNFNTSC